MSNAWSELVRLILLHSFKRLTRLKLIREAEMGSASHIDRLCYEWPRNPSQSNRALGAVLCHFKVERKAMWDLTTGQQSIYNAACSASLIRACLAAMDGALDYIREATSEVKEGMYALLILHVASLLCKEVTHDIPQDALLLRHQQHNG